MEQTSVWSDLLSWLPAIWQQYNVLLSATAASAIVAVVLMLLPTKMAKKRQSKRVAAIALGSLAVLLLFTAFFLTWRAERIQVRQLQAAAAERIWSGKMEVITGQEFRNQTVELDGKHFVDCLFVNVTFDYKGTGTWAFDQIRLGGDITMRSDNPGISGYVRLVEFMENMANREARIGVIGDDGKERSYMILTVEPQ